MPGRPPRLHPDAIAEARAAREWYEARSAAAGAAFMAELDVALERIEEAPGAWSQYLAGTRRYLLRRFPFFVVFRHSEDGVQIVAVAHASRQPGYWAGR